jgi:adenylylsulfate kinase
MFAQHPGNGFTIWLTGMQGAGKRSLAREVANRLRRLGKPVEMLEGADWDVFLGKGPGSTKEERNAIVRRNGFISRVITRAGGFAIVAQISPYRETREAMRREIGRFLEVFVDCPDIMVLMNRDTTGQYMKAMKGEIPNFIGITDPYEPPSMPEVRYDSSKQTVDDGAQLILEALVREGVLEPSDVGLSRMPSKKDKEKKPRKPPANIQFTAANLVLPKPAPPRPEPVKAAPAKAAAPAVAAKAPEGKKGDAKKVEAPKAGKKVEAPKAAPPKKADKKAEVVPLKKADKKADKKPVAKSAPKKVAAKTARAPEKKEKKADKKAEKKADKKDKKAGKKGRK